ncbi:hypothetical protein AVEN_214000-1 [Araneus ventricosus]|uniref:Uncharacterized protein n=1 Tax=Araneus ventricosus TaxID=182803 RepID=A0A4Y2R2Z9_ARAVE|nr:hypothetical protein AVEN_214000-1 [Araneus ventricosus]
MGTEVGTVHTYEPFASSCFTCWGWVINARRTVRGDSNSVDFSAKIKGFAFDIGKCSFVVRRFPRTFNGPAKLNESFLSARNRRYKMERKMSLSASIDPSPTFVTEK